MKDSSKGWKHPGMRSGDYSRSNDHDHDRRNYAGIGPKGYKKKDSAIKEEVCEILLWDTDVDASGVEVSVTEGVVLLDGVVDSRHAKKRAERVLEAIPGVKDVQNHLVIRQHFDLDSDKIITRGDEGLFTQETIQR